MKIIINKTLLSSFEMMQDFLSWKMRFLNISITTLYVHTYVYNNMCQIFGSIHSLKSNNTLETLQLIVFRTINTVIFPDVNYRTEFHVFLGYNIFQLKSWWYIKDDLINGSYIYNCIIYILQNTWEWKKWKKWKSERYLAVTNKY